MGRLIAEPIEVFARGGWPQRFIWRRRVYTVTELVGRWREPGAWWDGEPVREFFRVTAGRGSLGVYELCREDGRWFLHRVLD